MTTTRKQSSRGNVFISSSNSFILFSSDSNSKKSLRASGLFFLYLALYKVCYLSFLSTPIRAASETLFLLCCLYCNNAEQNLVTFSWRERVICRDQFFERLVMYMRVPSTQIQSQSLNKNLVCLTVNFEIDVSRPIASVRHLPDSNWGLMASKRIF